MECFSYILDKDPYTLHFVLKILFPTLLKRFWIPHTIGISILQSQLFKRQLTSLFWPE